MHVRFGISETVAPLLIAGGWLTVCAGETQAAPPTEIRLSSETVVENIAEGEVVAVLSVVDPDGGGGYEFDLVRGDGDDHNVDFSISGNELEARYYAARDFEEGASQYFIRLQVTDSANQSFTQTFVLDLTDDLLEDADRDGMTETVEEQVHGTSDVKFDTDGDGVGDAVELASSTSPLDPLEWPPTLTLGWGKSNEGEQAIPVGAEYLTLASGENHSLGISAAGTIDAWGGNGSFGQTAPPAGLADVVALAAGGDYWIEDSAHSVALKADGTVAVWGYEADGRLAVPEGLGPVLAVSAGRSHCIALKNNGTVMTWGRNPFGEIEPPPGLGDVVAVAAGGFYSMALKGDGTVVAWGSTFDGSKWTDVRVPVGLDDVVAISAGRFHHLALKNDGTVVAWGFNENGETLVPAGLNQVAAVTAGGFHSLALKDDGSVVAWGLNSKGQTTVPVAARSGVKLLSAGLLHSFAARQRVDDPVIVSSPRILAAPGVPLEYRVQVNNAGSSSLVFSAVGLPPNLVIDPASGMITGTVQGAARRSVRIQVKVGSQVLTQAAWVGISEGLPPTAITLDPVDALPPPPVGVLENSPVGTVVGILKVEDPDVADSHTFEWVEGSGSADNELFRIVGDQLILDQAIERDFDQDPASFSIRVRARDASLNPFVQEIAVPFLDDRTEDQDGDGLTEQEEESVHFTSDTDTDSDGDGFGDKYEVDRNFPPSNSGLFPTGRQVLGWGRSVNGWTIPPLAVSDFIDVSAGEVHSLGLKSDGTVVAWGGNGSGQATVPETLQNVIAVEAGGLHSLALKSDGTVSAWGSNSAGQSDVSVELGGVVAISAGGRHNLALLGDGTVTAWGDDSSGQATVPAGLAGVVAVAAGGSHSLALKSDGTVAGWGAAAEGASLVPPGLGGVIAIAAGGYHSLALRYDGSVVAWGFDADGQATVPVDLRGVTEISAGWEHSLALKEDGTVVAWGNNEDGQISIPPEAIHLRKIAAGKYHNLAIRQDVGFPAFADVSPVRSWPGEALAETIGIENAAIPVGAPAPFSAMGLPDDLGLNALSGLISGNVTAGERKAVRISVATNQGRLDRVIWFDTAGGVAATGIALMGNIVPENGPARFVVGEFSVEDPNAGDTHTLSLVDSPETPESFRFQISGKQLTLRYPLNVDFDSGITGIALRVVAVDSGNNAFFRDFVLQLTDDRTEDTDGDGVTEAAEEDLFGTSDVEFESIAAADADQDGLPGVIEYAFNLNPKAAGPPLRLIPGAESVAGLPTIDVVEDGMGGYCLRMEFLQRTGGDFTYAPQFGGDLGPGMWEPAGIPVMTPVDDDWVRCVVYDSVSIGMAPRRFGRVGVLYAPVVDRSGDADDDGISRELEEDVFGTSDLVEDDFRNDDLDGDGVPGIIEYAFNLDPKLSGPTLHLEPGGESTAGLPAITLVDAGNGRFRLRIEFIRRVGGILSYAPQFGDGLNPDDWETVTNPVSVTPFDEGRWERYVFEDWLTTTSAPMRLGRVVISW